MNKNIFYSIVMLVLLTSLTCNLPFLVEKESLSPTEQLVQITEEIKAIPTEEIKPTETEIIPTNTAVVPDPTEVSMIDSDIPIGFAVSDYDDANITFYLSTGEITDIVQTPGMSGGDMRSFHVAGRYQDGEGEIPVVYVTFDEDGSLRANVEGEVRNLADGNDVASLKGAKGLPIFVYVRVFWDNNALISRIYGRTITGGGASWAMEFINEASIAVFPLAVNPKDDYAEGMWYTIEPWGIGGDIVFPPRMGLYYLDLISGESETYLSEEFNPSGLSPDRTWVAYSDRNVMTEESGNLQTTVYNLETLATVEIALDSTSNRGSGYTVFSPGNEFLAWMEGSGWQMAEVPDFHSLIRIAKISGEIISEIPVSTFATLLSDPGVTWAKPAGWIDSENLIVECRSSDWNQVFLVQVKFDGSDLKILTAGSFAGFLYP